MDRMRWAGIGLGPRGAEGTFVLNIISLKLPFVLPIMAFFMEQKEGKSAVGFNFSNVDEVHNISFSFEPPFLLN